MQMNVDEKHADHAKQQAADAGHLHGPGQIKPFAQIGYLGCRYFGGVVLILVLQSAHQLGIRQKPVGIGQHNE